MWFRVTDAANNLIYESGGLNDDQTLQKDSTIYQSIPVDREGNHVWKHDLFNMIGVSYRKFIPSGGADVANYNFKIPSWAKSPITVSATIRYRKFNTRYAKWVLTPVQTRSYLPQSQTRQIIRMSPIFNRMLRI